MKKQEKVVIGKSEHEDFLNFNKSDNSKIKTQVLTEKKTQPLPMDRPKSCKEALKSKMPNSNGIFSNGFYVLDVDGSGPQQPFSVFCDMDSNGGGWARVGEDLATCGTGSGKGISALARTELLNDEKMAYNQIKAAWSEGRTWCSPEKSTGGWDCSYNFGIINVENQWVYDGRDDSAKNRCRGCGYKEFRIPVSTQTTSFFIVDPENYTNTSEPDNGCTTNGMIFDVWIK